MTTLEQIEELESLAVGASAKPLSGSTRAQLTKLLEAVRTVKRDLLAGTSKLPHLQSNASVPTHIDQFGKAADGSDAAMMFRPERLSVIAGPDGFFAALRRRAGPILGEERMENWDGPQPAPVYADALSTFRRQYFGQ
jgi:hypothetical protein